MRSSIANYQLATKPTRARLGNRFCSGGRAGGKKDGKHNDFRKKKELLKVKQPEPKEEWTVGKVVLGALGFAVCGGAVRSVLSCIL